jgi:hypothetical protein
MLIPREAKYTWETEKPYHWTEDAGCAFLPPTMFMLAVPSSRIAEGLSSAELRDLNEANFEAAEKVCIKCPVRQQCLAGADRDDLRETVRGGNWPSDFPREIKVAPSRRKPDTDECSNGHVDWARYPNSPKKGRYCKTCANDAAKRRRVEKAEAQGTASKPRLKGIKRGERCALGHDCWYAYKGKRPNAGRFECKTCKNERDRVSAAKRRAAAKLEA